MTREEIAKLVGEDVVDADFTINLVLKQLKPEFIKMCIKAELDEVNKRIAELKVEGYISKTNGMDTVYWHPGIDEDKYCEADILLYKKNRLMHLLYHN